MNVTIDDQIFTFQRQGGVARYFTELIRQFRMDASLGVDLSTPFRYIVNEYLLALDPDQFRRARLPHFAQRERVLRPINRLSVRHRSEDHGVLHHTYYLPDGLRVPAAARVCTIYDMIPEKFPDMFPDQNPHRAKREYAYASDAIVCISQTTKDDLQAIYEGLDKPVIVTPLGVDEQFFVESSWESRSHDFVLYVGQRGPHKNFDVLVRAFERLASVRTSLTLLCVGPPLNPGESATIAELGLSDRVHCRYADDNDLPALFGSAVCFVFPSLYEGFGLPIIEAFAAGCPVILANTPSSLEVGAEAAQYFSPEDDESLAGLIDQIMTDGSRRHRWSLLGRSRAREFTWRRTAELTSQVYRELTNAR